MTQEAHSVDAGEVARFARLAERWWDPAGPMRELHRMNPIRVGWLRKHLQTLGDKQGVSARPLQGLVVLDVGCGAGILAESLTRLGADVTGIDPAPEAIDVARTHAQRFALSVTYRTSTVEALATEARRFDAVCLMEVVEHVSDMPTFVAAAGALVRPGGMLFVSTLNRTLRSFALAIVGAEYVLRWVPPGTHQWEKFVTPAELHAAFAKAGVRRLASTGMIFNPLTRRWSLGRDESVNYLMAGVRTPGE